MKEGPCPFAWPGYLLTEEHEGTPMMLGLEAGTSCSPGVCGSFRQAPSRADSEPTLPIACVSAWLGPPHLVGCTQGFSCHPEAVEIGSCLSKVAAVMNKDTLKTDLLGIKLLMGAVDGGLVSCPCPHLPSALRLWPWSGSQLPSSGH